MSNDRFDLFITLFVLSFDDLFVTLQGNQINKNMMDVVTIKDKRFRLYIPESVIIQKVQAVAERINHDMAGKNPLFIAVLNGSFMFASDLMRHITIPCEISFV